jgi:hypothetical protein
MTAESSTLSHSIHDEVLQVEIKYSEIDLSELRGNTLADFLVNMEANIEVVDGDRIIYRELSFPVVELARELAAWMAREDAEIDGSDFTFSSMSFDVDGAIEIKRLPSGWVIGSVFTPEVRSAPMPWEGLSNALNRFVGRVRSDVQRLGFDGAAGTLIWGPRRRWGWRRCRAGGRVCASAVAEGELAVLEVAEELVPLGVGRWALVRSAWASLLLAAHDPRAW